MKFKYENKVEIVGGFYKGHTGTVKNYKKRFRTSYQVQLDGDYSELPFIKEKYLKHGDNDGTN